MSNSDDKNTINNDALDKDAFVHNESFIDEKLPHTTRRSFLKSMGLGSLGLSAAGVSVTNIANAKILSWSETNTTTTTISNQYLSNQYLNGTDEGYEDISHETVYGNSEITASESNKHFNNLVYSEVNEPKKLVCSTSKISTRLFSSSNASTSDERNQLAIQRLTCAGFDITNQEIMSRKYYRFGGTDKQRISDFEGISNNPALAPKLLLGVRGGYGAMRLLKGVDWRKLGKILQERQTILGGFSDVTAIQCALLARGHMGSFNLPMAYSEFGKLNPDPVSCSGFAKAITSKQLTIATYASDQTHESLPTILASNSQKTIAGTLWGGNLSVLSSLSGSVFMPNPKGGIVFIEEVGEQPYRIERMLYDMYLTGAFENQQAIVFGAMARSGTDGYDPSYNVGAVIRQLHKITGLPIYNGVGFGHVGKKQSFPMGFECRISPSTSGFDMTFSGHPTIEAGLINTEALSMVI